MSHNVCYDYNKCLWNLQPGHLVYFRGARWLVTSVCRSYVILSNRDTKEVTAISTADDVNERLTLCDDAFWDSSSNKVFVRGDKVDLSFSLPIGDLEYTIFRVDQKRCRVCLRVVRTLDNVYVTKMWVDYDDINSCRAY